MTCDAWGDDVIAQKDSLYREVEHWPKEVWCKKKTSRMSIHQQVREWILVLKTKTSKERKISTQTKGTSTLRQELWVAFSKTITERRYEEGTPTRRCVMLSDVPRRQLVPKTRKYDKIKLADSETEGFSISISGISEGSRELINQGYTSN